MVVAAVVVLSVLFIAWILVRNKRSKLPGYLQGKKVGRYEDLITDRPIYIATYKDPGTRKFVHQAYYAEDGSPCPVAICRLYYGFMYVGEGMLRMVPKKLVLDYLQAVQEGRTPEFRFGDRG